MENNTLTCPYCGKEISTKFTFCPFCKNYIYNPTKVTAAEFIENRKVIEQNESQDLRKKILELYNIKGDVTDGEFAQLKNFYQADKPNANSIVHNTSNNGETLLYTLAIILLIMCIIGGFWLMISVEIITGIAVICSSLLTFAFTSVFLTISENIRVITDLLERKM